MKYISCAKISTLCNELSTSMSLINEYNMRKWRESVVQHSRVAFVPIALTLIFILIHFGG